MQKWEYCVVGPVKSNSLGDRSFWGHYPNKLFLTGEGRRGAVIEGSGKKEADNLAKAISELGDEGWELIGTGNVAEDAHFLYFKRPKS